MSLVTQQHDAKIFLRLRRDAYVVIHFFVHFLGSLYQLLGIFAREPPEAGEGRRKLRIQCLSTIHFLLWSINTHGTGKFKFGRSFPTTCIRKTHGSQPGSSVAAFRRRRTPHHRCTVVRGIFWLYGNVSQVIFFFGFPKWWRFQYESFGYSGKDRVWNPHFCAQKTYQTAHWSRTLWALFLDLSASAMTLNENPAMPLSSVVYVGQCDSIHAAIGWVSGKAFAEEWIFVIRVFQDSTGSICTAIRSTKGRGTWTAWCNRRMVWIFPEKHSTNDSAPPAACSRLKPALPSRRTRPIPLINVSHVLRIPLGSRLFLEHS